MQLVTLRTGLCDLLAKGIIELDFSINLFNNRRVVIFAKACFGHPIAMNMNVVKGFQLTEISRWAR